MRDHSADWRDGTDPAELRAPGEVIGIPAWDDALTLGMPLLAAHLAG